MQLDLPLPVPGNYGYPPDLILFSDRPAILRLFRTVYHSCAWRRSSNADITAYTHSEVERISDLHNMRFGADVGDGGKVQIKALPYYSDKYLKGALKAECDRATSLADVFPGAAAEAMVYDMEERVRSEGVDIIGSNELEVFFHSLTVPCDIIYHQDPFPVVGASYDDMGSELRESHYKNSHRLRFNDVAVLACSHRAATSYRPREYRGGPWMGISTRDA